MIKANTSVKTQTIIINIIKTAVDTAVEEDVYYKHGKRAGASRERAGKAR